MKSLEPVCTLLSRFEFHRWFYTRSLPRFFETNVGLSRPEPLEAIGDLKTRPSRGRNERQKLEHQNGCGKTKINFGTRPHHTCRVMTRRHTASQPLKQLRKVTYQHREHNFDDLAADRSSSAAGSSNLEALLRLLSG